MNAPKNETVIDPGKEPVDQGTYEPVVLQLAKRYVLEPPLLQLIQEALELPAKYDQAHRFAQISPVALLLTCIYKGRVDPGFHSDTSFLASRLNQGTIADKDSLTRSLLRALLDKPQVDRTQRTPQFPDSMEAAFGFAQELAPLTTKGEKTICLRHLIGSICLLLPGWGEQGKPYLLQNVGLDIETLARAFLEHILHSYPADDAQVWKSEFAKVLTGIADPLAKPVPGSPETIKIGGGLYLDRTASDDEVALRADDYAEILKDFFTQAGDGELCFALYGPWGRGKTFQMQRLAKKLESDKKTNYATVFFSAWRYPNAPEVWVHLYETFAQVAYPANLLLSLPRLFRAAIAKRGAWHIIVALCILLLALLSKGDTDPVTKALGERLDILIGAGSLAWLGVFILEGWRTTKRLTKDYLTATHHSERLGLQATIGRDLRALLEGWMPQKRFPFDCSLWLAPLVLLAIGACAWLRLGNTTLGAASEIGIPVLGVTALYLLVYAGKPPAKALLVVDDLDRCRPEQLLSVMESVKVLVEDGAISKRVQVAMLIEEDVLKQAIVAKYKNLRNDGKDANSGPKWSDERIWLENCEKLFTAHLRLPPLGREETKDVLRKVLEKEGKVRAAAKADGSPTKNWREKAAHLLGRARAVNAHRSSGAGGDSPAKAQEAKPPRLTPDDGQLASDAKIGASRSDVPEATVQPGVPVTDVVLGKTFSDAEVAAISSALPRLMGRYRSTNESIGPRTIRGFVFRYQLARLILNRLAISWKPTDLALSLAESTATPQASQASLEPGFEFERVIQQVS